MPPALTIYLLAVAGIIAALWARNSAGSYYVDGVPRDATQDPGADTSLGADMAPSPSVAGLLNQIGAAVTASLSGTRGLRNNNPGNIRASAIPWQGKTGNDGVFEIFASAADGIRALGRNLLTYQNKYGLDTIEKIIARWAPSNENNTAAYVASVSKQTGLDPRVPINLNDPATLTAVTAAIIQHENGSNPYDLTTIQESVTSG